MRTFWFAVLAVLGGIMLVAWVIFLSMDFGLGPGLIFPSKLSDFWEMGLYYPLTYGLPLAAGLLLFASKKVGRTSK